MSVDGGCEVRNLLRWQVNPQVEIITPTIIFIRPCDCESPSLDRESEFILPHHVADFIGPWVDRRPQQSAELLLLLYRYRHYNITDPSTSLQGYQRKTGKNSKRPNRNKQKAASGLRQDRLNHMKQLEQLHGTSLKIGKACCVLNQQ